MAAVQQFAEFEVLPAPSSGINAIANLASMGPTEALYMYNMICAQNGPTVRPGWNEWNTGLIGTGGVRTIIPSRGGGTSGTNDYMFAATANGIYPASSSGASPALAVTFGTQTGNAGYCEWDHCTNAGADVMLLVCDEVNGYYTYDTQTATWLKVVAGGGAGQVSGVDPATFVSVRVFNNRVWFVQGGTGDSWYLPVGQVYGAATKFSWGNKFQHGGNLNNLYVFTYGSYYGTFIYLVGMGDAGDILAYSGIDPNSASSWTLSGQWYVGDLPAGRRSATSYGGDLIVLCSNGALPVSSLFFQKNVDDPSLYITQKIQPAITSDVNQYGTVRGFQFIPWPSKNSLIIAEPITSGVSPKQFCYNLATKGWSVFQSLRWQCGSFWRGQLYCGTDDGRVIIMQGNADGVKLNGTGAIAINWGSLSSFQQGKHTAVTKIVDLIRAYFLQDQSVSFQTFARYDFDLSDPSLVQVPFVSPGGITNGWDSGVWDSAIWSGGGESPQVGFGALGAFPQTGIGEFVAIGVVGASMGNCTHVGYGVSYRPTKGFL